MTEAGFDATALGAAVTRVGQVVRVVITSTAGSAPRGAGAAMLVWPDGQEGTIGGGALEWHAIGTARTLLTEANPSNCTERLALGPGLGQCCGGAVVLVYEIWDHARLAAYPPGSAHILRPVLPNAGPVPAALRRAADRAAAAAGPGPIAHSMKPAAGTDGTIIGAVGAVGAVPIPPGPLPGPLPASVPAPRPEPTHRVAVTLSDGWLIEPLASPTRHLWVWGAGHVGRAVVTLIAPMPDWTITWVDHDHGCFAPPCPAGVTCRVAPDPASLVADAPHGAHHLIMTRSHPLDLAICHGILTHGFATAGLIGSASKAGRFRTRLQALGHTQAQIARICCPIGMPALGKHPQAIAIGVAQELIRPMADG